MLRQKSHLSMLHAMIHHKHNGNKSPMSTTLAGPVVAPVEQTH